MTGKEAFVYFYMVFWSVFLPAMSRFRPFSIDGFAPSGSYNDRKRFFFSLLIFNFGPAALFFCLHEFVIPKTSNSFAYLSAVFAALSVFGFSNIGWAFFGSEPFAKGFYNDKAEYEKFLDKTGSTLLLEFAAVYFFVFPMLALVVAIWA